MYKKKLIISITVSICGVAIGLFMIKGMVAMNIQERVIQNTQFTSSSDIIEKGIEELDMAIKLSPRKYLFHATRANLNCRLRKYYNAIDDYNNIFEFKPDYAEGHMAQGMIYDWIDRPDSALMCYEIAERIYKVKLDSETEKDNIAIHKINIVFLKILQNETIIDSDIQIDSEVKDLWNPILKEVYSKSKEELLNEMFEK